MKHITFIAAAALFASAAAPAFAGEAPRMASETYGQRAVTSCERDALTQAAFRTEHGARPTYVTADQVVQAAGERWSTPRCISTREQQRLVRMMSQRPAR